MKTAVFRTRGPESDLLHWMEQITAITKVLGELKGTFTKAGQMLSVIGEQILPPEINKVLKQLQADNPPLEWKAMRAVLEKELGKEKLRLLEIDPEPIAAASIGQVYRAKHKPSGTILALKVQVPGVARAIDSDISLLKRLFQLLGAVSGGYDWSPILREVQEMMHQETNYEIELEWTEKFRSHLENDSRFVVPKPWREFSSRAVIASEFIEGVGIDSPTVASLSQERRNRIGIAALELFLTELFTWGEVQTDPHFGNYRLQVNDNGQDALVLFDFGAVRAFPKKFREHYRTMLWGAATRDPGLLRAGIIGNGFLQESDPEEMWALLGEILLQLMEPYYISAADESIPYDFGSSDLPARMMSKSPQIFRTFRFRPPPRELVFLDRRLTGTYVMLAKLSCKFAPAPLLRKFLQPPKTQR